MSEYENETDGFLDDGAREGAVGVRFAEVGDSVVGEVIDKFVRDYIPFGKKEPEIDEKTGKPVKQLVLILQTELRNWEGTKHPVDQDGNKVDPAKDTGRRALYLPKGKNIYAAAAKAVAAALPAGEKPGAHPKIGSRVGMQFFEAEDTGKGNDLKKFRGKYTLPAEKTGDSFFDDAPAASKEDKVQDTPAASKTTVADEEPPF